MPVYLLWSKPCHVQRSRESSVKPVPPLSLIALTAAAVFVTAAAGQDTPLELSGELRVRSEWERGIVGTRAEGATLLRTRLRLHAPVTPYASVVIQFQDSRVFGE